MADSDDLVRVHVDFNDMDPKGRFFVLPDDVGGELSPQSPVVLYDGEGNSALGTVFELLAAGRAMIAMTAGSWRRAKVTPNEASGTVEDQVFNLLASYLQMSRSLASRFQSSIAPSGTAPQTATPASTLPRPQGAVLSSM